MALSTTSATSLQSMTHSTPSQETQMSMPSSSPTTGPSWDHTVYVPAGCFWGREDPTDDALACVEA
eukprot:6635557-Pyramimonas_sp.AAC.1